MPDGFELKLTVKGLKETQAKMTQVARDLTGDEMLDGMRRATLMVTRSAKGYAPVDTGRLRSSILPEVKVEGKTVRGVIGSKVTYAPYQELGTRPHWPPVAALQVWAARHGTSAFLVARAIAFRGTRARRFLQRAFEDNETKIVALIGQVVARITNK